MIHEIKNNGQINFEYGYSSIMGFYFNLKKINWIFNELFIIVDVNYWNIKETDNIVGTTLSK